MDSLKPTSVPTKNKLAKKFQKIIHLKKSTKTLSNNGFSSHIPQEKSKDSDPKSESPFPHHFDKEESDETKTQNRASMEAFISKLFATISVVKAAYAQLQMAQFPYNGDAIQSADQAMVHEFKEISELKQRFLKKEIDYSPPYVALLLSEIQEQQSLMNLYEITIKKMESEIEGKESQISWLQKQINDSNLNNKSLEKILNSSGSYSVFERVKLSGSNLNDFVSVLQYCLRSIRTFVKIFIREMESANWDINIAANSIVPEVIFPTINHMGFAFEAFVCCEMFNGFNNPNFSLPNTPLPDGDHDQRRFFFFDRFKKLKSTSSIHYLRNNPNSTFGKFTMMKYLCLVHPKMEASFSGNLNPREKISKWEFTETKFFEAFAEMAKWVWLLHCLAFSFDKEVRIFQVRKNCRFSEVYMESVADDVFFAADGEFRVAFTVVPGFKIGKTVVQSQVYLSSAVVPTVSQGF